MIGNHPGQHQRFENIDALRGLAALLVIWLHVAEVFVMLPGVQARGTAWYDVAGILNVGRVGVIAFFAISGYVIVPTVRAPRAGGTIDFLIKRLFRLFPPFWLAIAVAALTVWYLFDKELVAPVVWANLTMIPLEFQQPQMMGHFWTLEVELIFYAVVLTLFWSRALYRENVIAWLMTFLALAWVILSKTAMGKRFVEHNEVWPYLSYFLSVMFWGAMLRNRNTRQHISAVNKRWHQNWPFFLVTALVFGRPLLALTFGSPNVYREEWRGTLLGLILFLAATRVSTRYARPFVWLGTISYSLYLLHPAVFYPLFYVVLRHPSMAVWPLWTYIVLSILASIACAAMAYRFVEKPANAVARNIITRRSMRTVVHSSNSI